MCGAWNTTIDVGDAFGRVELARVGANRLSSVFLHRAPHGPITLSMSITVDAVRYRFETSGKRFWFGWNGLGDLGSSVGAAVWAHVKPADSTHELRYALTTVSRKLVIPWTLWNARREAQPRISAVKKLYRRSYEYSLPSTAEPTRYFKVDAAGTAHQHPSTRSFSGLALAKPLQGFRGARGAPQTRVMIHARGAYLTHRGDNQSLRRNYKQFIAACDSLQHAATQIQRVWRGCAGRRRAREAKREYYAPGGQGCLKAKKHFLNAPRHMFRE